MSNFVQRCLDIYWSSEFNDDTIDAPIRMKAVLHFIAQEVTPEELCREDRNGLYTEARAILVDAIDEVV